MDKVLRPMGLEPSFVDLSDPAKLRDALRPNTKMVWLETPTNPMLKIFDIAAICEVARGRGIPVVVDNTFATPILQSPLALGASVVLHSTTKYLNGHSDVVGGAVVTSDEPSPSACGSSRTPWARSRAPSTATSCCAV
jgi:cystathionine beta-lyase/cystathionine gamma-synthase